MRTTGGVAHFVWWVWLLACDDGGGGGAGGAGAGGQDGGGPGGMGGAPMADASQPDQRVPDATLPDAAVDAGAGGGQEFTLTNQRMACSVPDLLAPAPGEEGHLSATRLTPPAWPFYVQSIRYEVAHLSTVEGYTCDARLPHKVLLFKSTEPSPPRNTPPVATLTVEGLALEPPVPDMVGPGTLHPIERPVEVTLEQGEHLFIAVRMVGENPDILCTSTCRDGGGEAEDSWWSNAVEPPYDWATLRSFGIVANTTATAHGFTPTEVVPQPCDVACQHFAGCLSDAAVCEPGAAEEAAAAESACLESCGALALRALQAGDCAQVIEALEGISSPLVGWCGGDAPPPPPQDLDLQVDPLIDLLPVACVNYALKAATCIAEQCPLAAPVAGGMAYELARQCAFDVEPERPDEVYGRIASLEEAAELANTPCDAPALQEKLRRHIDPAYAFNVQDSYTRICRGEILQSLAECIEAVAHRNDCGMRIPPFTGRAHCYAGDMWGGSYVCFRDAPCGSVQACESALRQDPNRLTRYGANDRRDHALVPQPDQVGTWFSVLLTPPSWPYRVDSIHAEFLQGTPWHAAGSRCTTAEDTVIEVHVTSGNIPAANPVPVAVIPIEGVELEDFTLRIFEEALPEPITLQENESLVLAVKLAGSHPDRLTCLVGTLPRLGGFFFSQSPEPPYAWQDPGDRPFSASYQLYATGAPVEP